MAETRNYLANAGATPPAKPGAPSTGYPQTAVAGVTEATVPGQYWYYQIAEEIRNLILAGGLTPDGTQVDQAKTVAEKLLGRSNNGDPNGTLAAHVLFERAWDTSKTPAALYYATAADGTTGGTTWTRYLGDATTSARGLVELATNAEATAKSLGTRALTPANLAALASTTSLAGLIELATTAEAQAGTDASRAVTPARLQDTVLGMGQTWQDMKASRAFTTNYTNSTGRSIAVAVTVSQIGSTDSQSMLIIDGVTVMQGNDDFSNDARSFVTGIVPPGSVYSVTVIGSENMDHWTELR